VPCARRPLLPWLAVGALVLVLAVALPTAVVDADALPSPGAAVLDDGAPPLAAPPPPIVVALVALVVAVVALTTVASRPAPPLASRRLRAPPLSPRA
jgi:hypothetical protein